MSYAYPHGACIRFNRDGPAVHENGSHESPYVTSVRINGAGEVEIRHGRPEGAGPISSVVVSPDETLTGSRGVIAGASGGTGTTRIRFFDTRLGRRLRLNRSADYRRVEGPWSNVWVTWLHVS